MAAGGGNAGKCRAARSAPGGDSPLPDATAQLLQARTALLRRQESQKTKRLNRRRRAKKRPSARWSGWPPWANAPSSVSLPPDGKIR
ncbi:hypothetical protein SODG_000923 [Sodalis praecaptivus]